MIPAGGVERIHASTKAPLPLQSVEYVSLPRAFSDPLRSPRKCILIFECGCERRPSRRGWCWWLCAYHEGFEDGVKAGPG
jgi:hypothetical protein